MLKKISFILFLVSLIFAFGCTKACSTKKPAKRVFFVDPIESAKVLSEFHVKFGVEGMKVRPAGEDVSEKTSGHHHILIDNLQGYIPEGQAVPADETNIHYGKGQIETTLKLKPGKHTLTLQFANGAHLSYGKNMANTITVFVEEPVN